MKLIQIAKAGKIMNQPHGKNPSKKLDSQIFLEKEDPQHASKYNSSKNKKKECDTCKVNNKSK